MHVKLEQPESDKAMVNEYGRALHISDTLTVFTVASALIHLNKKLSFMD